MSKNKYQYLGFAFAVILLNYLVTNFNGFSSSLTYIFDVIKPIVIGVVVAYFIYPIVGLINKYIFYKLTFKNIGYYLSILTAYLLLILIFVLLYIWLSPIVLDKIGELSKINYDTLYIDLSKTWQEFQDNIPFIREVEFNDVFKPVFNYLKSLINGTNAVNYLNSLFKVTSSIYAYLMGLIVSVYVIISKDELFRATDRFSFAVFNEKHYYKIKKYFLHFELTFRKFFFGKMLDSLIIGILAFIGMFLLNIPFYPILAIIVMVTNMIPYFGPFIGGIPVVLVTLFMTGDPWQVFTSALFILALQQFDGIYLGPKILGDSVGVSAVWVIIAIIIGGALFGVIGLFLCVPVAATLRAMFEEFYEYRVEQRKINKKI